MASTYGVQGRPEGFRPVCRGSVQGHSGPLFFKDVRKTSRNDSFGLGTTVDHVESTVENHFITGGLGSLVCEAVATNGIDTKVIRVGVEDLPISEYGDSEFLEKRFMTDIGPVVEEVSRGKRHK